jgi:predicted glycoside hydrolase/deacetylase ChbG (UPF0249 family)
MTAAIAPTVSRHASVLVLCADDYALTEGVSRGIEELACAGRLSATSVMTTTRHWPAHATRIGALRDKLAVGLHFNLTLGTPRGPMPSLAPTGRLPKVGALTARALRGAIDRAEIAAELDRQLDAFETALGHPPDFLDGHQHVHALPGVRSGVLATLARRYPDRRLLLRDPADTPRRIVQRAASVPKALILAALACGFGRAARRAGCGSSTRCRAPRHAAPAFPPTTALPACPTSPWHRPDATSRMACWLRAACIS